MGAHKTPDARSLVRDPKPFITEAFREPTQAEKDAEFEAAISAPGVLDDVIDLRFGKNHQAQPTNLPSAVDRERTIRQLGEFIRWLARELGQRVQQFGFVIGQVDLGNAAMNPDNADAWRIQAKDCQGRRYEIFISVDEVLELGEREGDRVNLGDSILATAISRLLKARASLGQQ
jgi:hypothetical protein